MPSQFSFDGIDYAIQPLTLGQAKKVASLAKEIAEARGDEERQIDLVAVMLGALGCPQELADVCPVRDIGRLRDALIEYHYGPPTRGNGSDPPRGDEPSPETSSSPSTDSPPS